MLLETFVCLCLEVIVAKYHVRTDGSIGKCSATIECPLNSEGAVHVDNMKDAWSVAEDMISKEFKTFSNNLKKKNKNNPFARILSGKDTPKVDEGLKEEADNLKSNMNLSNSSYYSVEWDSGKKFEDYASVGDTFQYEGKMYQVGSKGSKKNAFMRMTAVDAIDLDGNRTRVEIDEEDEHKVKFFDNSCVNGSIVDRKDLQQKDDYNVSLVSHDEGVGSNSLQVGDTFHVEGGDKFYQVIGINKSESTGLKSSFNVRDQYGVESTIKIDYDADGVSKPEDENVFDAYTVGIHKNKLLRLDDHNGPVGEQLWEMRENKTSVKEEDRF